MWAWIAISRFIAVFIIRKGRTKKVAQALLSKDFKGILCSDRYSAYQWIPAKRRQLCWAHLERDFRKISQRTGISQTIGTKLLNQTNQLFHHWHQFKEEIITRRTLKRRTKPIRVLIESLLKQGRRGKNKKSWHVSKHLILPVRFMAFSGSRKY